MPDYQRRRKILVVILVIAAIAYFSRNHLPWSHHHGVTVDINADSDGNASKTITAGDRSVTISTGDTRTAVGDGNTKMALALPGGFKADVNVPKRFIEGSHMDIDGVGMYPGATVGSVDVNAGEGKKSVVTMMFDAPAAPAAVADWFQQRFADKGRAVTRAGDTLSGKTEEGKAFTIALSPNGKDSKGVMTILGD